MADNEYNEDENQATFDGDDQANYDSTNGNGTDAVGEIDNTEVNTDHRKIFVGALPWELSEVEVKEHFTKYGEVEIVDLKKNHITGKNRGFCFITFKCSSSVGKVLDTNISHAIGGKVIDCKKAKARKGKEPKVFVGGVDSSIMTEEQITEVFSEFGEVQQIIWPEEKITKVKKPYVFVMYDKIEEANKAIAHEGHKIAGKEVDVRAATPAPDPNRPNRGRGNFRGDFNAPRGRGGPPRGRGRGGYNQSYYANQPYYDQSAYGGQGYGGYGYDYSSQYPGYDYSQAYDYSGYNYPYDQSAYAGYTGYDQSGYYNQPGYNYDWGSYYNQGAAQQPSNYGKAPRGRGAMNQTSGPPPPQGGQPGGYHPYSRQ